jgi:hypothetical protein
MRGVVPNGDCDAGQAREPLRAGGGSCSGHAIISGCGASAEKRLRAALLAAQARDSALTTASAEVKWRNGFALGTTFEGEFSNVTRGYAGKRFVRHVW